MIKADVIWHSEEGYLSWFLNFSIMGKHLNYVIIAVMQCMPFFLTSLIFQNLSYSWWLIFMFILVFCVCLLIVPNKVKVRLLTNDVETLCIICFHLGEQFLFLFLTLVLCQIKQSFQNMFECFNHSFFFPDLCILKL
jgi:hypothetical protein